MRNKSIYLLLTALFMLVANFVHAYTFSAANNGVTIYYDIISSANKTVKVTYQTTAYNDYRGAVNIPESVSYNGQNYKVIQIGPSAFRNCGSLTFVTIPNSVTSIEPYAFHISI